MGNHQGMEPAQDLRERLDRLKGVRESLKACQILADGLKEAMLAYLIEISVLEAEDAERRLLGSGNDERNS